MKIHRITQNAVITQLEQDTNSKLDNAENWLKANKLTLNEKKNRTMNF